ncbi:chromosome segregation ATPase [Paenibacillus mesophilus]|uniref:chromosome segregation ATPase n=1 Tax=Paenibacillus mesophilus TaxID=2582849 RepID=UPI00110DE663|nr:chromosome segregation ATPase [Paenibacillus mesophilus]TMV52649.1 chromosome segregation ATPase [Paenibacillus mesophilus]
MPAISKIRFTHVLYEGGNKRYNDETFWFDGHNGAILLENGGGKTVFIQTAIQAVLPHADLAGRKLKDTLLLENGPAHIAVEWILNDKPRRRYAVTCVSLFQSGHGVDSYRYAYEYGERDDHGLDHIPFVKPFMGKNRPADKGEIQEYYASMAGRYPLNARLFATIKEYKTHLEEQFQIIPSEWEAIVKINDTEGGIEKFFDDCKTTSQLLDRLLIPTVEQAMEGYEEGSFAKLFETHREGFKKYKELKEQIGENRTILQEMDKLVRLYERLYEAEQRYDGLRREAKSYWRLSIDQQLKEEEERGRVAVRLRDWTDRSAKLGWKRTSLQIAKQEQAKAALEIKLQTVQEERDRAEGQLKRAEKQYYSLQFAEYREKLAAAKGRMNVLAQSLERLERSEEEHVLQERWERNAGQLRSVFERQEREDERRQRQLAQELGQIEEQAQSAEAENRGLIQEQHEWSKSLHTKEAEKKTKHEQQQRIARSILANPLIEKVEDQFTVWAQEQQSLEDGRVDWKNRLKRLEEERESKQERRKQAEEERSRAEKELAKLEEREAQLGREQQELKRELAALRPAWERISSVYEKQSSLAEQLGEGVELRLAHKQKLLDRERLAYRFVDDHGAQPIFYADPMVERMARQWERQFSLLQLGTEYIAALAGEAAKLGGTDRLWAVTLVTTEQEKPVLLGKLRTAGKEFAFPIRVLDVREAADAVKGRTLAEEEGAADGHWVVPEHWSASEEAGAFERWKKEMLEKAEAVKLEREGKERELAEWRAAQRRLETFMRDYPLSVVQSIETNLKANRELLLALVDEQKRLEQELNANRQEADKLRIYLEEAGERIVQLGIWLRDAQDYMELGRDIGKLEQELMPVREQLDSLQKRQQRRQEHVKLLTAELQDVRQALQDVRVSMQVLKQDELYREVQSFAFVEPEAAMAELKEERKSLALERHRIGKERSALESEWRSEQERANDCVREMEKLRMERPDTDEDAPLPPDPERKREWWGKIRRFREEANEVAETFAREEKALREAEGMLLLLGRQYEEQYPDEPRARFEEPLQEADRALEREQSELRREQEELHQRQQQIERQLRELDSVLQTWNKYTLTYQLEDPRIEPTVLSADEQSQYAYKRTAQTEAAVGALRVQHERLEKEKQTVWQGKQRLKEFCLQHVQDMKLRQMFVQGVEAKESYGDILEFQQTMENRIQRAIHIAEQTIQTHDQDLQHYIQHIHTHLKQIVQELKELPKKTRVRTEDGWKDMYAFTIPEWDEQTGKERIRQHIEWILRRLEHEKYTGEQGQEQQTAMRKDLEKWLDSRQLMQVVMQNESVGITCRKVSNDHQVTKAAYSWEQSNRWSGGEKWSKNMTLFLGLLNYVAERKQYIQGTMKRHRTVILDNPFGKASSEHVLSPVFFIADQLGFQIIALTAHAEGKFLQDYFPVVYSCRLRQAADSGKQIMEATQRVQHAYFRDNAPETLERLGARVSQIQLF